MKFNIESFYYKPTPGNILAKYEKIYILVPLPKYPVFYELGMMLSNTLTKMGYSNSILVENSHQYMYEDDALYIIYGADDFTSLPNKYIIYQFSNYINLY